MERLEKVNSVHHRLSISNRLGENGFTVGDSFISDMISFNSSVFETKICIRDEDIFLTWEEFYKCCSMLEKKLLSLGISKGDRVGLYMDSCCEMVVSMAVLLKMGIVFVPLDVLNPESRVLKISDNAEVKAILTNNKQNNLHYHCLNFSCSELLQLFSDSGNSHNYSIQPVDIAYIMHTSGSTGLPKGVEVSQDALRNLILSIKQELKLDSRDKVLAIASPSFDVFLGEVFTALVSGAELFLISRSQVRDAAFLKEHIVSNNISLLCATATTWGMLKALSFIPPKNLLMISTGEPLPQVVADYYRSFGRGLWNLYGPTETTVWCLGSRLSRDHSEVPIGRALPGYIAAVLDENLKPVPVGKVGELWIGGTGLAKGYLNQQDLTDKVFREIQLDTIGTLRMYSTGDFSVMRGDGQIYYLNRIDDQVKINGVRIELREVEKAIDNLEYVEKSVVGIRKLSTGRDQLIACILTCNGERLDPGKAKCDVLKYLPMSMCPSIFFEIDELPTTANGKIDKKGLFDRVCDGNNTPESGAKNVTTELRIMSVWKSILELPSVNLSDNFFDIGGDSFAITVLAAELAKEFLVDVNPVDLIQNPSVREQVILLNKAFLNNHLREEKPEEHDSSKDIAIIGIGLRLKGAETVDQFWQGLYSGNDFVDREVLKNGKVRITSGIENVHQFDSAYFGIDESTAKSLDPQHRILLECAWKAFEDAGHVPGQIENVGVFTGVGTATWLLSLKENFNNYIQDSSLLLGKDSINTRLGASPDYSALRISYQLGLKGPSLNLQSACSTSLVAVHQACRSILSGDCEMALAGASSFSTPSTYEYFPSKDSVVSKDGHCRVFSAEASGTVFSNGCGVVLLRKLDEAINAGDHIYSVIKGSAINNDGSDKISYTAPSVNGQVQVIKSALKDSGLSGDDINFVETHGTATLLGDPVEVEALQRAYNPTKTCYIGSVKSNYGHLVEAAGIVGLIKASLSLKYKCIPPSLHAEPHNELLRLDKSSFEIASKRIDLNGTHKPLRAAVSAFGFGGTNAHIVLEQPPEQAEKSGSNGDKPYLLPLSGINQRSLIEQSNHVANWLNDHSDISLSDLAYTASTGRRHNGYRKVCLFNDIKQLKQQLIEEKIQHTDLNEKSIAFSFTGQGKLLQYGLKAICDNSIEVRQFLTDCCTILENPDPIIDLVLYGSEVISPPSIMQPALVIYQLCLSKYLTTHGLQPQLTVGHSIGEISAAFISGGISLESTLLIAQKRGELIENLCSKGSMLVAFTEENEISELIKTSGLNIEFAAYNSSENYVLSGSSSDIDMLDSMLKNSGRSTLRLDVDHAFHSFMMEPMLADFYEFLTQLTYHPFNVRFISSLKGKECLQINAEYWVDHARSPVRFDKAVNEIDQSDIDFVVEIGTSATLCAIAKSNNANKKWIPSIKSKQDSYTEILQLLKEIFNNGFNIDWDVHYSSEQFSRLPFPGASFQKTTYPPVQHEFNYASNRGELYFLPANIPESEVSRYECNLDLNRKPLAWMKDHIVDGQCIMPMTAYCELISNIFVDKIESICITNLVIKNILLFDDNNNYSAKLHMTCENKSKDFYDVKIYVERSSNNWQLLLTASVSTSGECGTEVCEYLHQHTQISRKITKQELYESWYKRGIAFGESFQVVEHIEVCEEYVTAQLVALPILEQKNHTIDPTLLDGAIQSIEPLLPKDNKTWVHAVVERIELRKVSNRPMLPVYCQSKFEQLGSSSIRVKVGLFDKDYECIGEVHTLLRDVQRSKINTIPLLNNTNLYHELRYVEVESCTQTFASDEVASFDNSFNLALYQSEPNYFKFNDSLNYVVDEIQDISTFEVHCMSISQLVSNNTNLAFNLFVLSERALLPKSVEPFPNPVI